MAQFKVTDPNSGRTVVLTGDSPPTEAELEQIFSQVAAPQTPQQAVTPQAPQQVGASQTPQQAPQQPFGLEQQIATFSQTGLAGAPIAGAISEFLGTGRRTPETEAAPEIGALGGADLASFRTAAGLISAAEPERQVQIVEQQFPGSSAFRDDKGNVFVDVPSPEGGSERFVLNKPGFSTQDILQNLGRAGAFLLRLGRGRGVPQEIIRGAGAAGAAQAGLEGVAAATGAETEGGLERIATEIGLGAIGEIIPGLTARRELQRQASEAERLTARGREVESAAGIRLFPEQKIPNAGEATNLQFLFKQPETSQRTFNALREQNIDASRAVDNFLDEIAPPEVVGAAAGNFQTAAQRAIDATRLARAEEVSPLYRQAFDENPPIDTSPVVSLIDEKLPNFPQGGEIFRTLRNVRGFLTEEGAQRVESAIVDARGNPIRMAEPTAENLVDNIRVLHGVKLELDQLIRRRGTDSLGASTRRELEDVRRLLLSEIDSASPAYREARAEFARLSPEIEQLEGGVLGRIADFDPAQLKNTARTIFNTNVATVQNAKRLIERVDPSAWRGLVREHLDDIFNRASVEFAEGPLTNIPAQLDRALGNQKQFNILRASLDTNERQNISFLREALQRAKIGRAGQSSTQAFKRIEQQNKRFPVLRTIRDWIASPAEAAEGVLNEADFQNRLQAMADVFLDPQQNHVVQEVIRRGLRSKNGAELLQSALVRSLGQTEEREGQP